MKVRNSVDALPGLKNDAQTHSRVEHLSPNVCVTGFVSSTSLTRMDLAATWLGL
ncbi:hypothetical protein RISK_003606 [Rhodopirellula islandica]|uniref:Uncharacterized protein n=1 Tax=Rhodopirellula islandica TaxID=595434 RepID=A0A0J1BD58_RHOIS|nr:hypothetical protein RISK_003606 [Rhodopirellula islandica]